MSNKKVIEAADATTVQRLAFSVKETAKALGLSVVTVRRACDQQLIRSSTVGRIIRIPVSEVHRVADQGLPRISRDYKRKTIGPTRRGRPRKAVNANAVPMSTKGRKGKQARDSGERRPTA